MDQRTLDRLGDEIAELSAHLDAAAARLLDLIRRFDAAGGWNSGFRSCAEWLSWRIGLDMGAAREKVRVARALATLPRLAHGGPPRCPTSRCCVVAIIGPSTKRASGSSEAATASQRRGHPRCPGERLDLGYALDVLHPLAQQR
jgi:hypothetical protein